MTIVSDAMYEEFFSQRLPQEGFVLTPSTKTELMGLIDAGLVDRAEFHGFSVTLDGTVIVPELRPKPELKN